MLEEDDIRDMFAGVLGDLYGPAVLRTMTRSNVRDPATGTFPLSATTTNVRAQRDVCTHKQMAHQGYSEKDVRIMVLQSGVSVRPNTDSEITQGGELFMVMDVDEDPCRVYWDLRARRK